MRAIHVLALALVLLLALTGLALAGGGPDWRREVLAGGASASVAGNVSLRATLGQPIVGTVSGGGVTVSQGFWHGGEYRLYLPLVLKN